MTALTPEQMRALADSTEALANAFETDREHQREVAAALRAAANELDRLRTVIENAPYGRACRWLYATSQPCTCWKADAL